MVFEAFFGRSFKKSPDTVDGSEIRRSPVEVSSLSHLHIHKGFVHPRW